MSMALSLPVRKFSWKQMSIIALILVYFLINIFQIGGDEFINVFLASVNIPLALSVFILALTVARKVAVGSQNRLLWWGLTLGWGMWTIAETWWGIALLIQREVAYPGAADLFWIAGYIPMFIALGERIFSLPKVITTLQRVFLWLAIIILTAATVIFVIVPIIQYNDPTALFESILNTLYPLVDLILMILILRMLFTFQQGQYGRAWIWLSTGFMFMSVSDLIYSFASTADLYYPLGQANFLSTFVIDIPYNMSYGFWTIGLLAIRSLQVSHSQYAQIDTSFVTPLDTHILIFTKGDGTVVDVSQNFPTIFPDYQVKGVSLSEVLGITLDEVNDLMDTLQTNRTLADRFILAETIKGSQEVVLSGITIGDSGSGSSGCILLIRLRTGDLSIDTKMTDYQKTILKSVMKTTGMDQQEDRAIQELILNYYRAFFQTFYNQILPQGGIIMADGFLTELAEIALKNHWKITFRPGEVIENLSLTTEETRIALPVLFHSARQYFMKIAGQTATEAIIIEVQSNFTENHLATVAQYVETVV